MKTDEPSPPPAAPASPSNGPPRICGPRTRPRVARDRRPRRIRLRHGAGRADAPLPRLVRPGDPAAPPALDDGLGLRGVRDGPGPDHGPLDAGLPRRDLPARARASLALPPRALSDLAPRTTGFSIERSLCLVAGPLDDGRPLDEPGSRRGPPARPAAARLPRLPPPPAGVQRLGSRRPRFAARPSWVKPLPYLPRSVPARGVRRDAPRPAWYRQLPLPGGSGARLRRRRGPLEPARVGVDAAPRRAGLRPLLSRRGRRRPRPPLRLRAPAPATSSRRRGTRSSTSSRAAPRRSSSSATATGHDPGRLPVARGLGPPGDDRGARASPSPTAASARSRRS